MVNTTLSPHRHKKVNFIDQACWDLNESSRPDESEYVMIILIQVTAIVVETGRGRPTNSAITITRDIYPWCPGVRSSRLFISSQSTSQG